MTPLVFPPAFQLLPWASRILSLSEFVAAVGRRMDSETESTVVGSEQRIARCHFVANEPEFSDRRGGNRTTSSTADFLRRFTQRPKTVELSLKTAPPSHETQCVDVAHQVVGNRANVVSLIHVFGEAPNNTVGLRQGRATLEYQVVRIGAIKPGVAAITLPRHLFRADEAGGRMGWPLCRAPPGVRRQS
jgi:hypothetical protein